VRVFAETRILFSPSHEFVAGAAARVLAVALILSLIVSFHALPGVCII